MLLIAIDTAGPDCAVAIARADGGEAEILARIGERIGRGHAERLMPMIEAALAEADAAFADLDRIAVTTGPGSFTGVRIGVAAARALALALDIPAVGIGSLDAIAFPLVHAQGAGTVVAALDAKRGEIYALAKDLSSGETLIPAAALPVDTLAAQLSRAHQPLMLIGAAAPIVAAALAGHDVSIAATPDAPAIEDVARLGFRAADTGPPVPLYVRGADAKPQADKVLARS